MKYKKFRPYKPDMIKLKKIRLPLEEMNGSSFVANAFSNLNLIIKLWHGVIMKVQNYQTR